jgi:hypothetical protein
MLTWIEKLHQHIGTEAENKKDESKRQYNNAP